MKEEESKTHNFRDRTESNSSELAELQDRLAAEKKLNQKLSKELARLRTSERLKNGNHYYQLFDSMQEAFGIAEIIYDDAGNPSDYRIVEINKACGLMIGFSPTL